MNEQDEKRVREIAYRQAQLWALVIALAFIVGLFFWARQIFPQLQDLQRRVGHVEQAK